jgi:hypothetical protein
LRHVENLSATEEEVVYICEPEVGRNINDEEERSDEYLIDFQEGRDEISYCQVGNKKRSTEDLVDCQEGRSESSNFQVGKVKKMRLSESLRNSERSLYKQGVLTGMMEMRLSESLKSWERSLDQRGVLREEDKKCILMIGGIGIFFPNILVEASAECFT